MQIESHGDNWNYKKPLENQFDFSQPREYGSNYDISQKIYLDSCLMQDKDFSL